MPGVDRYDVNGYIKFTPGKARICSKKMIVRIIHPRLLLLAAFAVRIGCRQTSVAKRTGR